MTAVVPAGLPNITGTAFSYDADSTLMSGAIYNTSQNRGVQTDSWNVSRHVWAFDASRCSIIYGLSETVQPPAFALLPQIKY